MNKSKLFFLLTISFLIFSCSADLNDQNQLYKNASLSKSNPIESSNLIDN